jgi:hypothetical protein
MPPSFEKPEAPKVVLDEAEFEEAFLKTQAKYPKVSSLSRNATREFLKTLIDRNNTSEQRGEEDYFVTNRNQTLRQYNMHGEAAKAYSSLAGSYFGGHRKKEEAPLETDEADYTEEQLKEAREAELLHEHGEERLGEIKKNNK